MKTVFEQVLLPTTPADLYATYLDPERHAAVIGAAVEITAEVGAPFTAFDGHVRGRTLHLEPNRLIVQTWGSDQMGAGHLMVLALDPVDDGTEVSLLHTGIPDDKLPSVDWPGRYWKPWRALLDDRRVTPEAGGTPLDLRSINPSIIEEHRRTGGQLSGDMAGLPVLLLTTKGRRTGLPHTTPLGFVQDGDRWAVAASAGGSPSHPDWYENLLVTPAATVEVGTESHPVHAVVATDAERDELFKRLASTLPGLWEYAEAAGREIPVMLLAPAPRQG